jgi:antitoxin component of MazEF toxin-antitoxin module
LATTVQNWGNSLAIRIPKYIAEQVKIEEGSKIEIAAENQSIKNYTLEAKNDVRRTPGENHSREPSRRN